MTDPRISEYEKRHQFRLLGFLGSGPGQDGFVRVSSRATAVKFFDRADRFSREVEIYNIIRDKGIRQIEGHAIPAVRGVDYELHAIEMTIVQPPFLLDFAGAKLPEEVPDFEEHVLDEHIDRIRELFEDRWADALHVAEMFRQATGFILLDIHPGNIAFGAT
jgi:hypothetical protein